jgi:hypothetical protein
MNGSRRVGPSYLFSQPGKQVLIYVTFSLHLLIARG